MSKERQLAEDVAGKGILGSYVQYARTLTAAPLHYHLATGLGVLAGAIGSSVTFTGGGNTEHWPNLYLCILGPTGYHKTTAVRMGGRLLARAAPGTICPNEFSREQFLSNLQRQPSALMQVDEFSALLAQMERNYQGGLKETLTDLYDPHGAYVRTLRGQFGKGEEIRIVRPALTILAASNVEWMVGHLSEVDFRSGFMPRFLLWPSDLREPEPPDGMLARGDAVIENSLVHLLHGVASLERVEAQWSAAARRQIAGFSRDRMAMAETELLPDELLGLISRSGLHAAKLAVLLCVSDNGAASGYEVSGEQAQRACALTDWLISQARGLFEAQIVFEKFEQRVQKFLRLLSADGSEWAGALRRSKLSAEDFRKVVATAQERGEVEVYAEATGGRGRSASAKMLRRLPPAVSRPEIRSTGNSGNSEGTPRGTPNGSDGARVVDFPIKRVIGGAESDM